jgi:asparaginyl-tRNA synthetase
MDLQSEHERYLTEEIVKGPMFLINYPKEIKAFYMRENEDGKTVAACDLLVPGEGEIVGGSQREERYDVLKAKMDKIGNTKGLEWYLNLRKYGGCKHAGFGIGFDRLLMYITGVANIRDTEPYPKGIARTRVFWLFVFFSVVTTAFLVWEIVDLVLTLK